MEPCLIHLQQLLETEWNMTALRTHIFVDRAPVIHTNIASNGPRPQKERHCYCGTLAQHHVSHHGCRDTADQGMIINE